MSKKKTKKRDHAASLKPLLRSYVTSPLAEYQIRADSEGRTVEAYAVPFDTPTEIMDSEGHYFEEFKRGAFGRQLAASGLDGIHVLYNHGLDLFMRPEARFAVPIGTPVEIREDGPGLFTATRYASTDLGDELLQLVRDQALTSYSIQFRRIPSGGGTKRIAGGHKGLDLLQRTDVRLVEYGPTPIPAYKVGAEVVGVRASQVFSHIQTLTEEERVSLSELLRAAEEAPPDGDPAGPGHENDDPASDAGVELLALRHELRTLEHQQTERKVNARTN